MKDFKIHILGCGSAMPNIHHYQSCQCLETAGRFYICDAGENMQWTLFVNKINYNKVHAIFITHIHGDHVGGLIGYIMMMGVGGRSKDLHIYGLSALERYINVNVEMLCPNLPFNICFHKVTGENKIYSDEYISVFSVTLRHAVECYGYIFREHDAERPSIDISVIEKYNVPKNHIKTIIDLYRVDPTNCYPTQIGDSIPVSKFFKEPKKRRSFAYLTDNMLFLHKNNTSDKIFDLYDSAFIDKIRNVTCLYHETSFKKIDEDKAFKYKHSCALDVGKLAKFANVSKVVIGHISNRYAFEEELLDEVREEFQNAVLGKEGMVIEL